MLQVRKYPNTIQGRGSMLIINEAFGNIDLSDSSSRDGMDQATMCSNAFSPILVGSIEQTFVGNIDDRYASSPPSFQFPSGAGQMDARNVRGMARATGNIIVDRGGGSFEYFLH